MEITHFFEALWQLTLSMAPYILFGLIFAGILHEIVPDSIVTKHLGKDSISSVIKSTVFGIPLPVCSCGVVPLATAIKKSGASKGATLSFLISTPITGVDSILATYGIFGWIFTLYRVISSMVIAIIAGILTNIFDKEEEKPKPSFGTFAPQSNTPTSFNLAPKKEESCGTREGSCCSTAPKSNFSLKSAFTYSFGTLLKDIAKPLFWGLILGAIITIAIPDDISNLLKEYAFLSYLVVIVIAVPMYVCATASLPIAAGLMLSGVSAGAAFVFLSAGPATNTVTIGVVKKMLGTKSLTIYLGSIIIGSVLFGLGLDYLFDISQIDPTSLIHLHEEASLLDTVSAVVLWGLILWFMVKPYFKNK